MPKQITLGSGEQITVAPENLTKVAAAERLEQEWRNELESFRQTGVTGSLSLHLSKFSLANYEGICARMIEILAERKQELLAES